MREIGLLLLNIVLLTVLTLVGLFLLGFTAALAWEVIRAGWSFYPNGFQP